MLKKGNLGFPTYLIFFIILVVIALAIFGYLFFDLNYEGSAAEKTVGFLGSKKEISLFVVGIILVFVIILAVIVFIFKKINKMRYNIRVMQDLEREQGIERREVYNK